ncbi:cation diffusion facilitator 1 [Coccidioides immitis H538.4]|uniref:Cation diffusion facilitator 1 n=1 Tax=Coccidioides immitis H538.4 TaxID=396776 RepID=A0A0J8RRR2_COCIT|nr:cation diffusion facilitator 1 [Coccidioides immitis H538.4]
MRQVLCGKAPSQNSFFLANRLGSLRWLWMARMPAPMTSLLMIEYSQRLMHPRAADPSLTSTGFWEHHVWFYSKYLRAYYPCLEYTRSLNILWNKVGPLSAPLCRRFLPPVLWTDLHSSRTR